MDDEKQHTDEYTTLQPWSTHPWNAMGMAAGIHYK
jgi:ElaB/YqjD/DUF883 family membrane-anchored ribosome-binding protein